jgi:hypothetical protein
MLVKVSQSVSQSVAVDIFYYFDDERGCVVVLLRLQSKKLHGRGLLMWHACSSMVALKKSKEYIVIIFVTPRD